MLARTLWRSSQRLIRDLPMQILSVMRNTAYLHNEVVTTVHLSRYVSEQDEASIKRCTDFLFRARLDWWS
ncbi:hypothetical protein Tco_0969217, partial [Tanacetum coccineum]